MNVGLNGLLPPAAARRGGGPNAAPHHRRRAPRRPHVAADDRQVYDVGRLLPLRVLRAAPSPTRRWVSWEPRATARARYEEPIPVVFHISDRATASTTSARSSRSRSSTTTRVPDELEDPVPPRRGSERQPDQRHQWLSPGTTTAATTRPRSAGTPTATSRSRPAIGEPRRGCPSTEPLAVLQRALQPRTEHARTVQNCGTPTRARAPGAVRTGALGPGSSQSMRMPAPSEPRDLTTWEGAEALARRRIRPRGTPLRAARRAARRRSPCVPRAASMTMVETVEGTTYFWRVTREHRRRYLDSRKQRFGRGRLPGVWWAVNVQPGAPSTRRGAEGAGARTARLRPRSAAGVLDVEIAGVRERSATVTLTFGMREHRGVVAPGRGLDGAHVIGVVVGQEHADESPRPPSFDRRSGRTAAAARSDRWARGRRRRAGSSRPDVRIRRGGRRR